MKTRIWQAIAGAAMTYVFASWSVGAILALIITANITLWTLRALERKLGPFALLIVEVLIFFAEGSTGLIRAHMYAPDTMRREMLATLSTVFVGAAIMSATLVTWNLWWVVPSGAIHILGALTGIALGWYANLVLAAGDI